LIVIMLMRIQIFQDAVISFVLTLRIPLDILIALFT
jgi:hypothetical protein